MFITKNKRVEYVRKNAFVVWRQSKERLLLRAEIGRDFLEDTALNLPLKAEAGLGSWSREGSIAHGGACYTARCGRCKT